MCRAVLMRVQMTDIKRVLGLKMYVSLSIGGFVESACLLVPCPQKGKCPVFFDLPHKFDGGLSASC